jgi:hypothetical protein
MSTTSKLGAGMQISENDMARVLFANLFPRGMCPADWDSGAILGPDNIVRRQFLDSAREVLDFLARQPAAIDKPVSAEYRCRKCGDAAEVKFSYASSNDCCRKVPCVRPGNGPCDMPARQSPSKSISDAMMDLVDRLGHEWKDVDPRAWSRLLIYAPSVEQDERGALDVSVLARLSAQIFDCPLNPTISKFARAVEAHIRAASTSANVAQQDEDQKMNTSDLISTEMDSPRRIVLTFRTAAAAEQFLATSTSANVAQGAEAVASLRRIAHELRTYNPAADEYKGEHIHKVWARGIEALLSAASNGEPK